MITGSEFSQAHIDEVAAEYDHVIVAVGFLGSMLCYLDSDYETIAENFAANDGYGEISEYGVVIHGFDNGEPFEVYDIKE